MIEPQWIALLAITTIIAFVWTLRQVDKEDR